MITCDYVGSKWQKRGVVGSVFCVTEWQNTPKNGSNTPKSGSNGADMAVKWQSGHTDCQTPPLGVGSGSNWQSPEATK